MSTKTIIQKFNLQNFKRIAKGSNKNETIRIFQDKNDEDTYKIIIERPNNEYLDLDNIEDDLQHIDYVIGFNLNQMTYSSFGDVVDMTSQLILENYNVFLYRSIYECVQRVGSEFKINAFIKDFNKYILFKNKDIYFDKHSGYELVLDDELDDGGACYFIYLNSDVNLKNINFSIETD